MISLKENINLFLFYLDKNRGYAKTSLRTYKSVLGEMEAVSHFYEEDSRVVLDITPFRLKIVDNSKRTISKKLSAVRSLLKFLHQQKELSITLLGDSSIKVPKTLPRPIDEKVIDELLREADVKQAMILTMLYGLGLRISELVSIELNSIGLEWITIFGKGRKEREIPLLPILKEQIEVYIKRSQPQKFLLEKDGEAMSTHQVRYLLTKLFKSRGIKATPHQLRHSFATHLLHNGARIADVSKLMGHSSMVSTQIYTQLENSKKLNEYQEAHPLCDFKNL
jgi:integrase/recombinase XerC